MRARRAAAAFVVGVLVAAARQRQRVARRAGTEVRRRLEARGEDLGLPARPGTTSATASTSGPPSRARSPTARGRDAQEAAHEDVTRIETAQRRFLRDGNLDLALPLRWAVYGDRYSITR